MDQNLLEHDEPTNCAPRRNDHDRRRLIHSQRSHGRPGARRRTRRRACEYSFNLIAGAPGAGKTTLVQQVLFANATPERPALYFTVLGEPTLKMLRYQRQFGFFDPARVPSAVRFINLAAEAAGGDLDSVLRRIVAEVGDANPAFVAVDSFRTIVSDRLSRRPTARRAGALRQPPRAAPDDLGSDLVSDRRILRRGAAASGVHRGRHDPLAHRGCRPKLGDA